MTTCFLCACEKSRNFYLTKKIFMATKRTTHRSTSGKKLYAVRDEKGRFVDIQTYQRAHSADLRKRHSKNDNKK
jgi:DNA-binding protein HU-beta